MDEREQSSLGRLPDGGQDPDPTWAEYVAWMDQEIAAGRDPEPEPEDPAEPWDPGEPWGPGNEPRFGQGDEADLLPPGPLLVALTEGAVRDFSPLSDNELIGILLAARRQHIREAYKQVLVVAEFARRRQGVFEDARDRGVPVGCRPGGFPGEELATELAVSRVAAAHQIENALDLTTRLPATLAAMAAGLIDEDRAAYIACYTHSLNPADAARADEILAAAAPDLRTDQLARKAAALEMKLNPEAVKARKEHEKQAGQRVEARREYSGNASLSAREMDTADALASKSYIDAMAAGLRNGGLDAPLGMLRVLAMTDLTQGRNPLDRLSPAPDAAAPGDPAPSADPAANARRDDPVADELEETGELEETTGRRPLRRTDPAPLPALVNLLVPAGTVLDTSTAPAQAGAWGLLDHEETRTVVKAASRHPRTRWCVTLVNDQGEAVAHACARGQHPRLLDDLEPQPPPARLTELLHSLNLTFQPIANGSCDHAHAEDRYTPSRSLRHLVRARTATCDAPGCDSPAVNCDLDHTVPYPDGPNCECNLGPKCRTHHRTKQAPDWHVEQPEPGVIRWTLPSGRTRTTTPTRYDL